MAARYGSAGDEGGAADKGESLGAFGRIFRDVPRESLTELRIRKGWLQQKENLASLQTDDLWQELHPRPLPGGTLGVRDDPLLTPYLC